MGIFENFGAIFKNNKELGIKENKHKEPLAEDGEPLVMNDRSRQAERVQQPEIPQEVYGDEPLVMNSQEAVLEANRKRREELERKKLEQQIEESFDKAA